MDPERFNVEGAALNGLSAHPLCAYVPASVGVSVRDRKIANPVVLLDGMILDGRARVIEARRLRLPCPCRNFDPVADEHPAILLGRAVDTRDLTPAQRAVLAERVVRVIMRRPDWLEEHDRGMADRLRNEEGRKPLLDAFGASTRHYRRAKGLHDDESLKAVFDLRISLHNAFRIRDLATATRRRIIDMPVLAQTREIDRVLARTKEKRAPTTFSRPKTDDLSKFVRSLHGDFYQGSWVSSLRNKPKGDRDE